MNGWRPAMDADATRARLALAAVLAAAVLAAGCRPLPLPEANATTAKAPPLKIIGWRQVDELPLPLVQFETVFWDSADTDSLRQEISLGAARGRHVLEIGAGTGLLSLCCLHADAAAVVATDINPSAVACTRYNAERLGLAERLEVRQVLPSDPDAFAVIGAAERFDLIVSNPPWEDGTPERIDDHAFYDPSFALLHSLLAGLPRHLRPGGRALLAYGSTAAIREVQSVAPRHGLRVRTLDDRDMDSLPAVFVPGVLLELTRE